MKDKGVTLVELIIFIFVLAISVASLTPFITILTHVGRIDRSITATELAQQRMELIIKARAAAGFANFLDPCVVSPTATICAVPSGYTVSSTIVTGWDGSNNFKVVTVTVSGYGVAELKSLVSKY